ncbi:MAG TPA: hypothetical protein VLF61_00975, partial [Rhabdochlamydiaceae bacterium]|nr:hypothetical protein [Rhabdochlamydiaceae bacterium]
MYTQPLSGSEDLTYRYYDAMAHAASKAKEKFLLAKFSGLDLAKCKKIADEKFKALTSDSKPKEKKEDSKQQSSENLLTFIKNHPANSMEWILLEDGRIVCEVMILTETGAVYLGHAMGKDRVSAEQNALNRSVKFLNQMKQWTGLSKEGLVKINPIGILEIYCEKNQICAAGDWYSNLKKGQMRLSKGLDHLSIQSNGINKSATTNRAAQKWLLGIGELSSVASATFETCVVEAIKQKKGFI